MKIIIIILYLINCINSNDIFPLSIIHINDFHVRFEPINLLQSTCNTEHELCIGGYARTITVIKQLIEIHNNTNTIYLNAGDNFQGTLWYNIGRWNVTSYFLNLLPADAMTLGNHEFADSIDGLVPFLETIKSPIVVCNIDDAEEPMIQGKYQKSTIIERDGRQIGIIGVIGSKTNEIAATGNLKFLNETDAILNEATILKAQGINIIIVLSHCGLSMDKEIARICGSEIDVIVGGHSHTFMYNGPDAPGPDTPRDTYPAIVNGVLIVQASAYTKYVGDLTVYFDNFGTIVNYEGNPIFLDTNIIEDSEIVRELQPWKDFIDIESERYVGRTNVLLDRNDCGSGECNIGNFITDAFVDYYVEQSGADEWTYAAIAFLTAGGIRAGLDRGDLNYGKLIDVLPFENTVNTMDIKGKYLLEALEYGAGNSLLQVSGLQVIYNMTNAIGNRVLSLDVLCKKCEIPEYRPINLNEMYTIIVQSYLADGSNGFSMLLQNRENHKVGPIDVELLARFVKKQSPILWGNTGRITILK